VDTITSAQLTDTLRTLTTINREMAIIYSDADRVINDIVYLYADTNDIIGMVTFLNDSCADQRHKKQAISIALSADTINWSRDLLDSLILEDANDTAFYDYYDVAIKLAEDTLTWFGMDSTQKAIIIELSEQDYEVSLNAQAVLALIDDSIYNRIPEMIPDSSGKWDGEQPQPNQTTESEEENKVKQISLYPNPFSNSFNLQYSFEHEISVLKVEIYDIVGRIVKTQLIGKTQTGTLNIDLGQCLGLYYVRLIADNTIIHKDKMICLNR